MIDPLTQGPILDMFMGVGSDPASQVFAELKRKAEEARAQAQAQNPGAPLPPIDYAALMEKATRIAAGERPEDTVRPEELEQARRHLAPSGMMPGETAGVPSGGQGAGFWGRIGRTFQGEEIPADDARRARFRALTDAGTALLASAGEGNLGRGLAEGLSAFQGGLDRELGSFAERRRRRELDDLARRSAEESIRSSRGARSRAEAGEERAQTTFEQSQEERLAARQVMLEQLREIEELAGPDSPEVDRARALVKGGPPLRDDLDELHQRLIARKRFPEDRAMETEAELERRKRLYEEDPGERFDREIARERLETWYGRGGDVTPTAMLSDLNDLAEQEFEFLLRTRGGPTAYLMYKEGMMPVGVNIPELREEAENRAEALLSRRRERVRGIRGGEGEGGGNGRGRGLPLRDPAGVGAETSGGLYVKDGSEGDVGPGRQALQIRREARVHGIEVSDEDLEKIRRDLDMGATVEEVRRRLGIP